jgi:glutathione synthase/RimK-type ligase-like ATP-grasp enzyme
VKTIVIFTRTIDPDGYPFNDDYHWNAYYDLLLALRARGAAAYFATDNSTYKGGGVFSRVYGADTKVPLDKLEPTENVRADLVFEKGGFTGEGVKVLNPPFVHKIAASKAETYRHFAKYQPKSIIAEDLASLKRAFEDLPGELIVVKEPESNGGRAVQIGPKAEVLERLPQAYPLIVQEFVDTSVGVPGLVDGIHDIRVKIGGGRIFGGMVRQPAPGEYRANLAQGGTSRHLTADELPEEPLRIAREIDCFFEKHDRYYAIDFANTAQGWKMIELNSKPGLSPQAISPAAKQVTQQLADYLIEICP